MKATADNPLRVRQLRIFFAHQSATLTGLDLLASQPLHDLVANSNTGLPAPRQGSSRKAGCVNARHGQAPFLEFKTPSLSLICAEKVHDSSGRRPLSQARLTSSW